MSGSSRILFVGVEIESGSDLITGVTYNGVSMTLVDKQVNGSNNEYCYLFYLIAPATGANNVVVSASGSTSIGSLASSYTGVRQSGQPDSSNKKTQATTASITQSTTVVTNNSWVIGMAQAANGQPTAGAGVTSRAAAVGENNRIGDSAGNQAPGAYSMTFAGGGSWEFNLVMASFKPASSGIIAFEI